MFAISDRHIKYTHSTARQLLSQLALLYLLYWLIEVLYDWSAQVYKHSLNLTNSLQYTQCCNSHLRGSLDCRHFSSALERLPITLDANFLPCVQPRNGQRDVHTDENSAMQGVCTFCCMSSRFESHTLLASALLPLSCCPNLQSTRPCALCWRMPEQSFAQ